ncbi:MAG: hypothetical protein OXD01_12350 [Gammaproteobacteria bacterium]|nr:hypothetical protein [Gammaproteobacteria bacterium]
MALSKGHAAEKAISYRRGFLVGMTMAEVAMLIIFILLLALTSRFLHERDLRLEAEESLLVSNNQNEEAKELLKVMEEVSASSQTEIAEMVQKATESMNFRESVINALESESLPVDEESVLEMIAEHKEQSELAQNWKELTNQLPSTFSNLPSNSLSDMLAENKSLKERVSSYSKQIAQMSGQLKGQGQGSGTEAPVCWVSGDFKTVSTFHIALGPQGYVIIPTITEEFESERKLLPVNAIDYGRILTEQEFLDQTRAVYDWSVTNECRFLVNAYDMIPNDKQLYKQRLGVLENRRFYKTMKSESSWSLVTQEEEPFDTIQ